MSGVCSFPPVRLDFTPDHFFACFHEAIEPELPLERTDWPSFLLDFDLNPLARWLQEAERVSEITSCSGRKQASLAFAPFRTGQEQDVGAWKRRFWQMVSPCVLADMYWTFKSQREADLWALVFLLAVLGLRWHGAAVSPGQRFSKCESGPRCRESNDPLTGVT